MSLGQADGKGSGNNGNGNAAHLEDVTGIQGPLLDPDKFLPLALQHW
jgi:hypothetical protein